jgi:two-component system, OmpR family, sensor kinase
VSVRSRFAATVAAVVAVTVALFATCSIIAIDRALRSSFAARLETAAKTVAATVDVHHGRISLDAGDLRQLSLIHADTPFAVYAPDGTLLGGTAIPTDARARDLESVRVPVTRNGIEAGSVTVWQSAAWIGDFDRDAAIVSVIFGMLLIGIGVAISQRVARSALAPVERIASLAERIEAHQLAQRLGASGDDELGRLCASFDRMLDRLEAAFARERRFVADASHELRAPLAVLRAETELALRRERSDDEYREALSSIQRETARLEELVDELLAAARAGVDARERRPLDAAAMMRELSERVRPAASVREVDIEVDADAGVLVDANKATLERALLAIVHNAIAFARSGGIVHLGLHRDGDGVRIEVADDGAGFSPDALKHATERFWRGDPARGRGGTGLGLSIARALVEANGGSLQLANGLSGGAVVRVSLPFA